MSLEIALPIFCSFVVVGFLLGALSMLAGLGVQSFIHIFYKII